MPKCLHKLLITIFWDKVRGTLWASGITLFIASLNYFNQIYPLLGIIFKMSIEAYSIIDSILNLLGAISLILTISSGILFYIRHKLGYYGINIKGKRFL